MEPTSLTLYSSVIQGITNEKCPSCARDNNEDATLCWHCRRRFDPNTTTPQREELKRISLLDQYWAEYEAELDNQTRLLKQRCSTPPVRYTSQKLAYDLEDLNWEYYIEDDSDAYNTEWMGIDEDSDYWGEM